MDNRTDWLDKMQIRSSFDKAAAGYDAVAVMQREVGRRLLERLNLMRLRPTVVADVGTGTGACLPDLARRYRSAQLVALDLAEGMLRQARLRFPWWRRWRNRAPLCISADGESLPLASNSCDLVFSNLTFQWCGDLDQLFAEMARVVRPGGLLLFSTLGPDTLRELRESWAATDGSVHVNRFHDMHDVGDAMVRAGLADPVMDMEHLTMTYRTVWELMRDLKTLGAHNLNIGRPQGLTGKGRLRRMEAAYERHRCQGILPATYEVVYGHAWGGEGPVRGDARVGVDVLRRSLRER